jgi:CheY-like chemotaxis protein
LRALSPEKDPYSHLPFPTGDPEASESFAETKPLRVLVIEDNDTDVVVIRAVLKRAGFKFQLEVATDGERALAALGIDEPEESGPPPDPPALILLDLNIPRISGLEVLLQVRGHVRTAHVPVVVVTSSESEDDIKAVKALQATAYFRKPTRLSGFMELAGIIRGILPGQGNF